MKKIVFIFAIAAIVASCEKEKEHKNLCPVISAEAVPTSVSSAFREKYPNVIVEIWFNKDNSGYVAQFTLGGKETKAQFDNNGNFQNEDIDQEGENEEVDQEGEHEDNDEDNGCECDTEDEHED